MKIMVAGLPGSGNHLIFQHLRRSNIQAVMNHAQTEWSFDQVIGGCDVILYPIRMDEIKRRVSARRRGGAFSLPFYNQVKMREKILSCGKPIIPVIYEMIIRSEGEVLDDILRSLGIEPAPWPKQAIDDRFGEYSSDVPWEHGAIVSDAHRYSDERWEELINEQKEFKKMEDPTVPLQGREKVVNIKGVGRRWHPPKRKYD